MTPTPVKFCPQCGTSIPPGLFNCPGCQSPVYAEDLKRLSSEADAAESENRISDALSAWRQALDLLPVGSVQRQAIKEKIEELGRRVDGEIPADSAKTASAAPQTKTRLDRRGRLGLLGLLAVLFSKLKFLLLGFGKLHTLFSMLAFFAVYWSLWGWKFALGFVLSIYVHEMGHVAALNRYGIKASAPMFIPFVGAFVRLKQNLTNPREDARVGLAGPIWGLMAALTAYGLFWATGIPVLAAIARVGGWINLFNLLPILPLDGGRGFQSLTPWQRWIAALVIALMWFYTQEGLLLLLAALALFQAFRKNCPSEPDFIGLIEYCGLIVVLSMMCLIPVAQVR